MLTHVIGPTVAPQSCKMSGTVDPVTQHNIPEDFHLQQHYCENLKSCNKPLGLRIKFHLPTFVTNYILSFILNMTGSKEFLYSLRNVWTSCFFVSTSYEYDQTRLQLTEKNTFFLIRYMFRPKLSIMSLCIKSDIFLYFYTNTDMSHLGPKHAAYWKNCTIFQ
jgi:hypothetical protein